jgi:hypothetical protein
MTDDNFKRTKDIKDTKQTVDKTMAKSMAKAMSQTVRESEHHKAASLFGKSELPQSYVKFTNDKALRSQWIWFNLIGVLVNIALGAGAVYVLENNPNECSGIKLASWSLVGLYVLNFVMQAMCLCGLEKKCCNTIGIGFVVVVNFVILTWA